MDIPFKWVLFNWNLHGHVPPGVYDLAHDESPRGDQWSLVRVSD